MTRYLKLCMTVAFATLAMSVTSANAQFEIVDYSIDGGAGFSTGGNFTVQGTVGQPDAGTESSGGNFTVTGGYDPGGAVLIGDVNGDGQVNLLDVSPFVAVLASGNYLLAADINQDGSVNLLDVSPFVDLLSG